MPVFNFTILGSVKVPEGVTEEDINIEVTRPSYNSDGKSVLIPDDDWDIHEVSMVEDV